MEDDELDEFIEGCLAKKGRVTISENTVTCELKGTKLVKVKNKSDTLIEEVNEKKH